MNSTVLLSVLEEFLFELLSNSTTNYTVRVFLSITNADTNSIVVEIYRRNNHTAVYDEVLLLIKLFCLTMYNRKARC